MTVRGFSQKVFNFLDYKLNYLVITRAEIIRAALVRMDFLFACGTRPAGFKAL